MMGRPGRYSTYCTIDEATMLPALKKNRKRWRCIISILAVAVACLSLKVFTYCLQRLQVPVGITPSEEAKVHAMAFSKKPIQDRNSESTKEMSRQKVPAAKMMDSDAPAQINNETNSSVDRPLFVLHIGPHKTATSTIQCELTYLKEFLHGGAYEYLGRVYQECFRNANHPFATHTVETRALINCLDRHDPKKRPCNERSEWKAFEYLLEKLAKSNQNVVLSDEAFSRLKVTDANLQLFHSTLAKRFRVVVVIFYRRYFEWALSMYNEKYKPWARRKRFQKWPDEKGGKAMRTFPDYYRRILDNQGIGGYQMEAEKANLHAVEYLKNTFEKYFDNITIFSMHQPSFGLSMTTSFIEQQMPGFPQSVLKKLDGDVPKRSNPSMNLDYDLLAVAAREKGLLRKSLKRFQVSMLVQRVLSKQPSNYTARLPHECLTQEEESAMLNRSLSFEQHLFPELQTVEATREHEFAFGQASRILKFCNIDAEAILENSSWQKLFRSL